jgi:FkbM family methyltransferase
MPFKRYLQLAITGLLALDVLALPVYWLPARVVWMDVTGRNTCPLGDAFKSLENTLNETALIRQFEQRSRVVERDPAGVWLWETPKGRIWAPAGDKSLPLILAEQQKQLYGQGARGPQMGDVVLDCGANVGMFSRTALARGASKVVAIEPAPATLECLRRNLGPEIAQGRVIVYPKGVWDKEDVLTLYKNSANAGSNTLMSGGRHDGSMTVPLTTIDHLAADLHLERIDFIKMDIEGAEKRALAGARNTLFKFKPRMSIAAEHLDDDPIAIPRTVRSIVPQYGVELANCESEGGNRIRPQVIFFY